MKGISLAMDRTQRLLAVVLGVQVVLLALIHNPFTGHGATGDQPLIPALQSITPEKVEIDGEQNAVVTLERSGGAWRLAQPAGYPAAPGKVEKLIQDLEHVNAHRQVVSGSRYHKALKVAGDDFERRVRIWEKASGEPKVELYVGTSPGAGVTHVRVGGNDRVYEASGLNAYDIPSDAASWIERNLVPVTAEDAGSVSVTNPRGSFALVKNAGAWSVQSPAGQAGATLDQQKVADLVRALCGMTLDQPVGAADENAQGLASPEATITVGRVAAPGATPVTVTVKIGALVPGKEDQRYATVAGSGFAVTVAKVAYDQALGATLAELVKK